MGRPVEDIPELEQQLGVDEGVLDALFAKYVQVVFEADDGAGMAESHRGRSGVVVGPGALKVPHRAVNAIESQDIKGFTPPTLSPAAVSVRCAHALDGG